MSLCQLSLVCVFWHPTVRNAAWTGSEVKAMRQFRIVMLFAYRSSALLGLPGCLWQDFLLRKHGLFGSGPWLLPGRLTVPGQCSQNYQTPERGKRVTYRLVALMACKVYWGPKHLRHWGESDAFAVEGASEHCVYLGRMWRVLGLE